MNPLHSAHYWAIIGVTLLCSILLMPLMMHIARSLGIIDLPAHRKIHREPIPYLGGLGIALSLSSGVLATLYFIPTAMTEKKAMPILGCYWLITFLGLFDDKFQTRARLKLIIQIAISFFFSYLFYRFNTLTIPGIPPIALGALSPIVTTFWLTSILNALNLIDGVDGLCASTSVITLAVIAVLAHNMGDTTVFSISTLSIAATLGFLFYNWRPARIYLGDAGSLSLAMLNAVLLISLGSSDPKIFGSTPEFEEPFSFHLPLATLILAYPTLEIAISVLRRFLKGKPIGSADKEHIHHLLLRKGWKSPQICFAAIAVSLLMGGVAVASTSQHRGIASWLLATVALLIGIGASYIGLFEIFHFRRMREKRANFLIANHFMSMQVLKLNLTHSIEEVFALINQTCTELGIEKYTISLDHLGAASSESTHYKWSRPENAHGSILSPLRHSAQRIPFSDQCGTPDSKSLAEWTFEQVESEDDLDVEYRVLFSGFMEKSLERIEEFLKEGSQASVNTVNNSDLSANTIRKRSSSDITQQS